MYEPVSYNDGMPTQVLPPHLIERNRKKICSACKETIDSKDTTLSKAFRKHIEENHRNRDPIEFAKTK